MTRYRTLARQRWPRAEFLGDSGPWATVSLCPPVVSVELYASEAAAARALDFINTYACGHACHKRHALVDLRKERAA